QAGHAPSRPVLPFACGQGGDCRSRHAGGRRQRRRVPVDDRELPVAVTSLWREPERREQLSFGALEFHDVFKIFRSGPVATLALRLAGRRRVDDAVAHALDAFDLRRRERTRAGALSGGEQQRVAIAAAAAREAPLVLADEPTAELDERNEQIVLEALARLRSQ